VSVPPSTVIAGLIGGQAHPGEQGGHRAAGARHRSARPHPAHRAGPAAGQRGGRAALIDEHQPRRIDAANFSPPPGARGLVALGGGQACCFNGRPARRRRPPGVSSTAGSGGRLAIVRDIVASDTATPSASAGNPLKQLVAAVADARVG
jgi:hypothetical protein